MMPAGGFSYMAVPYFSFLTILSENKAKRILKRM